MLIERIEIYHVRLPLRTPWRTAYGEDSAIDSVLFRMVSGKDEGWGETTPFAEPTYSPETAGTVFLLNRDIFCPLLLGQQIRSVTEFQQILSPFKGNPFAKAGPETAWWSMQASRTCSTVGQLLGATRKRVQAGADYGVRDSIRELLDCIAGAFEAGYPRVKLKIRPGWDLNVMREVRAAFPDGLFHVDCNSGYRLDDLPLFRQLDRLGLAMFEQPLFHRDLHDHARLQRELETAVCLDESITATRDLELALELGSCRMLNIKIGRVGGLGAALELHNLAQSAGMPCWVGGMLESGVGSALNIELAGLSNFTYPGDLFPSSYFYDQDLAAPPLELGPGCGFGLQNHPSEAPAPDPERLAAWTVQKAELSLV